MVEHYLWTENRCETDHFVLHHCHRIQTVNSFWGLMLLFFQKPDWNFLLLDLVGWSKSNKTRDFSRLKNVGPFWSQGFDLTWLLYTQLLERLGRVSMLELLLFQVIGFGKSQRCLVQHCWRQSLGNKTKVIRWLVGLIQMVWGNSFLWNLSALDQFEIFRFYSLHWFVFLVVSQTPLYLCHTWFS